MILQDSEYIEKIIKMSRVTKKVTGGNTLSFTALAVIGDKNGKVGVGYGKARSTNAAIAKAKAKARKDIIQVVMKDGTIPHTVSAKYGSSKVLIMPAPKGSGIIAGGAVRSVMELAGIRDVSAKMLGSNNRLTTARCVIKALERLRV